MNGNEPRAGGLRLIRMLIVALCAGAIAQSAATLLLWRSNDARVEQINEERVRNTRNACIRDSSQNRAIVDFIRQAGASKKAVKRAEKLFPVYSASKCAARAAGQIDSDGKP